jgi:hypothetical protein
MLVEETEPQNIDLPLREGRRRFEYFNNNMEEAFK